MQKKKQEDDIDFEIQFYEGVLSNKKDFFQALVALGDLYTRKGLYEKGLGIDRKLALLRQDDPIVYYNLACSYSLLDRVDEAYVSIKKAIKNGYSDFAYLEQDEDLAGLLKDSRFFRYLSRVKKKQTAEQEKDL